MSKKRTWLWILAAIAGICVIGLIVVAVAGIMFVRQHVETKQVTAGEAERAFVSARDRFKGQEPLIELDQRENARITRRLSEIPTAAQPPSELWILVWEPREEKLVRLSVPFWLLRLGRQNFNVSDGHGFDLGRLNLDARELERIGPALLMDQRVPSGERVLIWTQ